MLRIIRAVISEKERKQIEYLQAENESLRQQVEEQSDALIELAGMIAGGD